MQQQVFELLIEQLAKIVEAQENQSRLKPSHESDVFACPSDFKEWGRPKEGSGGLSFKRRPRQGYEIAARRGRHRSGHSGQSCD